MVSSSKLRPCYSSSSQHANVWSHPLTDHDTKLDVEGQTALYPPALGHSSSGSNFGMNAGLTQSRPDLTAQTIDRPPVSQMDFPPSTSEATVSPRMSILSLYQCVLSASGALNSTQFYVLAQMLTRPGQGLGQMFRLALDGLEAIGTIEITKLSLNLIFQMTACLVAYYIYSNSGSFSADQGSSSAAQLSKPLFYSVAAANTVGFLACWVGIAIRNTQRRAQRRAGRILGGTGAVFAAASFVLVMSTFIRKI